MSTDRIIESARRVAELWTTVGEPGIEMLRKDISPALARALDELSGRCSEPEVVHTPQSWKETSRGRAENGWQPETEYFWTCACREGHSGDMGGSPWAKQAADKHQADPTQFPGWLT